MKIKLATDERRFTIPIPNCLLFNPVSAAICAVVIRHSFNEIDTSMPHIHIGYAELAKLFAEISKCRHYLEGEALLTACSAEGEFVEIFL